LDLIDREGATRHRRSIIEVASDELACGHALIQATLPECIRAGEAGEVIAAIRAERAEGQIAPVVTGLLLRRAGIVRVVGTGESRGVSPAGGHRLLGRETSCDDCGVSQMHIWRLMRVNTERQWLSWNVLTSVIAQRSEQLEGVNFERK